MTARTGALLADVVVIGAGPAGSAAAIELARAGLAVVVADKARFPRDKCCGDGLTTGALRRLEGLGLDPSSVASFTPVADLSARSPSGRIARVPFTGRSPGGIRAAVARRADLDLALLDLARRAGATVLEGHAFEAVETGDETHPLHVRLAGGIAVRARYAIGADGAWSPLRRAVGDPVAHQPYDWHAFRTYASGVSPEAAEHLWVWFDRLLLPGYAWSFPLVGGQANVGICLRRAPGQRGSELAATWSAVLEGSFLTSLLGRDAEIEVPARSWPIPSGFTPGSLSARRGRVLFAGDAAGMADPFTGEGIAQALESGTSAAEAIVALGAGAPGATAERYRKMVHASIGLDHRLARGFTALLARPLGARGAVRLSGASGWSSQVGKLLYEDYPRSLLLAPWRWRPGLLNRPAPYATRRTA